MFSFEKYQGTGNDFIMIDDRDEDFPMDDLDLVREVCDRKFGVGADGLILIRNHTEADFEMIYYNSDGSQSLCGNGSRCAVMFASKLGIIKESTTFLAIDGLHEGFLQGDNVHIRMGDVTDVQQLEEDMFINTGSPHFIRFVRDVGEYPVRKEGSEIRYSDNYREVGTNVNFVETLEGNKVSVRTYERGVEDETLSCGTGVTAVSLAMATKGFVSPVSIETPGGNLQVSFDYDGKQGFTNIYLIGPAEFVFKGHF